MRVENPPRKTGADGRGDKMLTVLFLTTTVILAIMFLCSRISIMALLRFMDEKGYVFPTKAEMKACCRKTTEHLFKRRSAGKGMR